MVIVRNHLEFCLLFLCFGVASGLSTGPFIPLSEGRGSTPRFVMQSVFAYGPCLIVSCVCLCANSSKSDELMFCLLLPCVIITPSLLMTLVAFFHLFL